MTTIAGYIIIIKQHYFFKDVTVEILYFINEKALISVLLVQGNVNNTDAERARAASFVATGRTAGRKADADGVPSF